MRKAKTILMLLLLSSGLTSCGAQSDSTVESPAPSKQVESENKPDQPENNMKSLHDFKVNRINGTEFDLASLKGKKVLIVNTASECGLTPQYEQLQELYDSLGGDTFEIIGFPANNFGAQEPGTNENIAQFCQVNYGVTFPMMEKISVKDTNVHPVYQFLTQKDQNGVEDVEMVWNFQKILVDENGHFVKSVHPTVLPIDEEITNWINE